MSDEKKDWQTVLCKNTEGYIAPAWQDEIVRAVEAAIAATKAQCPHWFDKNQSSYYTDGGYRRYKSTKKPPTGGKEASDGKH